MTTANLPRPSHRGLRRPLRHETRRLAAAACAAWLAVAAPGVGMAHDGARVDAEQHRTAVSLAVVPAGVLLHLHARCTRDAGRLSAAESSLCAAAATAVRQQARAANDDRASLFAPAPATHALAALRR